MRHQLPICAKKQRQVGHDEAGRPVIYVNFAQSAIVRTTSEEFIVHMTYLIENAVRTMPLGVSTWVFVVDCTGMDHMLLDCVSDCPKAC